MAPNNITYVACSGLITVGCVAQWLGRQSLAGRCFLNLWPSSACVAQHRCSSSKWLVALYKYYAFAFDCWAPQAEAYEGPVINHNYIINMGPMRIPKLNWQAYMNLLGSFISDTVFYRERYCVNNNNNYTNVIFMVLWSMAHSHMWEFTQVI